MNVKMMEEAFRIKKQILSVIKVMRKTQLEDLLYQNSSRRQMLWNRFQRNRKRLCSKFKFVFIITLQRQRGLEANDRSKKPSA